MIVNCPQCGKQLKLGDKIQNSIRQLEPGRKIKVKCVGCAVAFGLDGRSLNEKPDTQGGVRPKARGGENERTSSRVRPPGPPDVGWLKEGIFEDKEIVEDIPRALVLVPEIPSKDVVVKAGTEFGYLIETASDAEEAIEKMRFVNYAAVFLHSSYEQSGAGLGKFHGFMRTLPMSRRRYIFYVLIGEQFETLYDLQALAYSANLVVNEGDIPYIGTVVRKAIPEYETLFGPLMEELRISGKF